MWSTKKNIDLNKKSLPIREGFDSPVNKVEFDFLGRRRIANRIYSHLTDLDPDWSVRVGLIAPWGEGKTTVARWVADCAEQDGHIAVWWSNPWAAKTDAEIWFGLYARLIDAFDKFGVKLSGASKYRLLFNEKAKWLKKIADYNSLTQIGLDFSQSILSISSDDIQKLKQKLQNKRVIVIVDDLDRADPVLLPRFLMSVREVMDLNCLSFLFPFDEIAVSDALNSQGYSYSYSHLFLEKIFDYRVRLPESSRSGIIDLFYDEIRRHCPFLVERCPDIESFLPSNPRRLKALVRTLRAFREDAERHHCNEIDWQALIFAQLIKIESEEFFRCFISQTFFSSTRDEESNLTAFERWLSLGIFDNDEKRKEDENRRLKSIINEANIKKMGKNNVL